ncbi:hypothetical protein [Pasteurella sp. PK-2025]|uniref:hypothetical protein n=1 Tax=Pasteurella sp. PK-2025 TaxID=3413133 RepID=UPI003C729EC7
MKKFWNYLFFSTWHVLGDFVRKFIDKPIYYFLFKISWYRKNRKKVKSEVDKISQNEIVGTNILYAYYFMLTSMDIFLSIIAFYFIYFFNIDFSGSFVFYFTLASIFFLSCFINERLISWNKSGYLKYFKEFEKERNKFRECLLVFLFHFGILFFAILSVYFTLFYK